MADSGRAGKHRVYGVDFSGAAKAGERIWVAGGSPRDHHLWIDRCQRGDTLPGSGPERTRCLKALVAFIAHDASAIFGCDFPFGLPAELVRKMGAANRWQDFLRGFAAAFATAEDFRAFCLRAAGGRELKRPTDVACRTPFAAYNLRLYRQTYYGLRDVLYPLVAQQLACVLPMQQRSAGRPWVIEVCPASTLKRLAVYKPYKGRKPQHRAARAAILARLEEGGDVALASPALREAILNDPGGDALDSVVAAVATFRSLAVLDASGGQDGGVEGYVYA